MSLNNKTPAEVAGIKVPPESVKVLHVSKVSTIGGEFTPKYEVVLVKY
jgi:hypothetical protein